MWCHFPVGVTRAALGATADFRDSGVLPAAVVMVLRENINSYSDKDMTAISDVLCTSKSDIWMISYKNAGELKKRRLFVHFAKR
jgi:hypothetical protein